MRKLLPFFIFLLFSTNTLSEKIPFAYNISYEWDNGVGTYYGYNNAFFENVPMVFSNTLLRFKLNITIERNLKDIKIILIQEYYCRTSLIGENLYNCSYPDFSLMTGDSVSIYNFSSITKDQIIFLYGSYNSSNETFSSLDRTHLIVMHCPDNYCEKHWEDFWKIYYHRYYNFNHLNITILENEDWKYFKWGKIILDNPFVGIWCITK